MSTIKVNEAQLGQSAESVDNYTFSNLTGVLNLQNGSAGNSQENLISVQATGNIDIAADTTISGSFVVPTATVSKTNTNVSNVQYVDNAINTYCDYYNLIPQWQTIATTGAFHSDLVFDSQGNIFVAVANSYNGTNNNCTSYVYKITPQGTFTQFASSAVYYGHHTALAIDSSDNLFWAVTSYFNGTNNNTTSNVYKITPAGSMSTFASVATLGGSGTSLAFDRNGNLYWAVMNLYNGTTNNLTGSVYKITAAGTLTTLATVNTAGAYGTKLLFDSTGNLFWAVSNSGYSGATIQTQYVYKIDMAGVLSVFASHSVESSVECDLAFDSTGNLHWALSSFNTADLTANMTQYLFKLSSTGAKTTVATVGFNACIGTNIAFDAADNIYWVVNRENNGTTFSLSAYVFKINASTGLVSRLASIPTTGGRTSRLEFDSSYQNLYWTVCNNTNGTTPNINSYVHVLSAQSYFI